MGKGRRDDNGLERELCSTELLLRLRLDMNMETGVTRSYITNIT
jgi:hypothetical protein